MPISHLLEDFNAVDTKESGPTQMSEEELEDLRLTAFEQGYSAGWEDAIKAQAETHAKISEGLAQSLEDLSFSYHEAATQMMANLEPVFQTLVSSVLPEMLHRSFSYQILEQLKEISMSEDLQRVIISVPNGKAPTVTALLDREFSMPVSIIEDNSLNDELATIRIGNCEIEIDTQRILDAFAQKLDAFVFQVEKDAKHG